MVDTLEDTYDLLGRMLTAANAAGTYTFARDTLGRLLTIEDPHGLTITFTRDDNGNMLTRTDSLGGTVTTEYDDLNRLTVRTQTRTGIDPLRVEIDYDDRGRLATVRRYADDTDMTLIGSTVYTIDADGNMTGITHKDGLGIDLVDYVNTFDDVGRILSEIRNSVVKTFAYDDNGQVTDDGTKSYNYDDNGNRTMPCQ